MMTFSMSVSIVATMSLDLFSMTFLTHGQALHIGHMFARSAMLSMLISTWRGESNE